MPIDPRHFIEVFRLAALQAGCVARHLQGKVRVEQKEGERTPEGAALTAVDLATQDVILHGFAEAFPGAAMDAEEDTPAVHLFDHPREGAPLIVLDPVDGTLNYTRGSDDYAVMGALIDAGRYQAALIHFPVYETTCWAVAGQGCFVERARGQPERVRLGELPDSILVAPGVPQSWRARLESLASDIVVSRCSAVDSSSPVLGRGRAAVSEKRADRRRALGFVLTVEAGGVVYFGDRRWELEDPCTLSPDARPTICASDEAFAGRVREALAGVLDPSKG